MVRDDKDAHISTTFLDVNDVRDTLARELDGIDDQTTNSFLNDGELGAKHSELNEFRPNHFTSRETDIHVA
ncbi:MAG: hypothetical protein RID07_20385, partial [Lacipirellulaceae bacterium]